ncbi:MAG: hypothetical protein OHK0039_13630 [Bacteroidia bacterium]
MLRISRRSAFSALLLASLLGTLLVSFVGSHQAEGVFVVGKAGAPIAQEVKQKLAQAYKAQYGKAAKLDRIEVVNYEGKPWLAFQSGGEGSPTLTIALSVRQGQWGFSNSAVSNTCTGNPCSWCYFDSNNGCICNRGNGSCNHTQTSGGLKGMKGFLEVLSI